jgi:hypothetical protein
MNSHSNEITHARMLAQLALLDASDPLMRVSPKQPPRKEKERLFKQITRRTQR